MRPEREFIHIREVIEYDITLENYHRRVRHRKRRHLSARYAINGLKIHGQHMDITILSTQNSIPGQLVPLAADGVTVEPISTITAGSEAYTSSDQTVATVAAANDVAEGAFVVTRVPGASGTVVINYTATNTDGVTITSLTGDTFTFLGQPQGLAQSLSATYGAAA